MKSLTPLSLLLSILLPGSIATAQFSVEFSSGEGYQDGKLRLNPDWQIFDGSGADPDTFTTKTEGSGSLVIDPTEEGFQVAAYAGSGSDLTSNTYYIVSAFQLVYPEGSSSVIRQQPVVLPVYELQNMGLQSESISFGLRQVKGGGNSGSQFNIFTLSKLNGSNDANFSNIFKGDAMGLSSNSSGKWTDGTSDVLALLYSIEYQGDNKWVEKILLTNVETSTRIVTLKRTVSDADDSFADNPGRLRMYGLFMNTIDVAVKVDSISVITSKE